MSDGVLRAWRLSKARYAGDLTGQGAARDGQRCNQPGQRAVVLGLTPEITVLEVLLHLNGVLSAPLVLCGYDVPATPGLIKEADPIALPAAQSPAPGHVAGGAGASGALPAGSTAGLTCTSPSDHRSDTTPHHTTSGVSSPEIAKRTGGASPCAANNLPATGCRSRDLKNANERICWHSWA